MTLFYLNIVSRIVYYCLPIHGWSDCLLSTSYTVPYKASLSLTVHDYNH